MSLFQFGFIRITDQGVFYAIVMAVRIICLIAGTTLLTYTTSPIVLTDGHGTADGASQQAPCAGA